MRYTIKPNKQNLNTYTVFERKNTIKENIKIEHIHNLKKKV